MTLKRAVLFLSHSDILQQVLLLHCSLSSWCLRLFGGNFRQLFSLGRLIPCSLKSKLALAGCSCYRFKFVFRFRPGAQRQRGLYFVVARAENSDFVAASLNELLAPQSVGCSRRPKPQEFPNTAWRLETTYQHERFNLLRHTSIWHAEMNRRVR